MSLQKIVCRVRPLIECEIQRGDGLCVYPATTDTLRVISHRTAATSAQQQQVQQQIQNQQKIDTQTFQFDRVFGSQTSQTDMFQECDIASLCESALQGRGVTITALGISTSGKTTSLSGPPQQTQPLWSCDPAKISVMFENFLSDGADATFSPSASSSTNSSSSKRPQEQQRQQQQQQQQQTEHEQSAEKCDPMLRQIFDSLGLLPRASVYLHKRVRELMELTSIKITLRACVYEIYNERVNDLLNEEGKNLKVRQNPHSSHSFFVENLMVVDIDSIEELFAVFAQAETNRKRSAHSDSTRSHVVFSLAVEQELPASSSSSSSSAASSAANSPNAVDPLSLSGSGSGGGGVKICGKLNFIDLAGSERMSNLTANNIIPTSNASSSSSSSSSSNFDAPRGLGLIPGIGESKEKNHPSPESEETKHINKSIFTLGKVLASLSSNAKNNLAGGAEATGVAEKTIPFRESVLTKLLMESLSSSSSSCLTLLCVTPSGRYREETLNTLRFAQMAQSISNFRSKTIQSAHSKISTGRDELIQLRREVEWLRRENAEMRLVLSKRPPSNQIASSSSSSSSAAVSNNNNDNHNNNANSTQQQQQEQQQKQQEADNQSDLKEEGTGVFTSGSTAKNVASFSGRIEDTYEEFVPVSSKDNNFEDSSSSSSSAVAASALVAIDKALAGRKLDYHEGAENNNEHEKEKERKHEKSKEKHHQKEDENNNDSNVSQELLKQTMNALTRVVDDNASLRNELDELRRLVLDATSSSSSHRSQPKTVETAEHSSSASSILPPSSSPNPQVPKFHPEPPPKEQQQQQQQNQNDQQEEKQEQQHQQQQQSSQVQAVPGTQVSGFGFRPSREGSRKNSLPRASVPSTTVVAPTSTTATSSTKASSPPSSSAWPHQPTSLSATPTTTAVKPVIAVAPLSLASPREKATSPSSSPPLSGKVKTNLSPFSNSARQFQEMVVRANEKAKEEKKLLKSEGSYFAQHMKKYNNPNQW